MTWRIRLRAAARADLKRLAAHFAAAPPNISDQMADAIQASLRRLTKHPFIGRRAPIKGWRELVIRFGKSRYIARYRITDDAIIITRI